MTASALVSGRLWGEPEQKLSKAGKPFAVAKLREGSGDGAVWWSVVAFSEDVCEELLALRDGEALAISGPFRCEIFEKEGRARIAHRIVAERLISARKPKKRQPEDRRALTYEGV
jgi:hypothetical protein